MPGYSIPDASVFQDIIEEFSRTRDGSKVIEAQGGFERIDRNTLMQIGESFLNDLDAAFASVLLDKSVGSSFTEYATVSVSFSPKKRSQTVTIRIPESSLFRPSFEKVEWDENAHAYRRGGFSQYRGTGERTGEGIRDIAELITKGYPQLSGRAWGYWDYAGRVGGALPQRQGTPFVPAVVAKYKAMYPDVIIKYPPEWG